MREWLGNQAAGGYVQYDADDPYSLSPEQALCLADPGGPVDLPGAYSLVEATFHALERTKENFRTGKGMEWGEHHPCLFHGTERFFRAGYNAQPDHQLAAGARWRARETQGRRQGRGRRMWSRREHHADGEGVPESGFIGYDYHAGSIEVATENGRGRRRYATPIRSRRRHRLQDNRFDLIAFFDCLHDMADPVGAARHARRRIKADGT